MARGAAAYHPGLGVGCSPLMPADINELRRSWEALGEEDAMWAVLTDPGKRGGGWNPVDFLASGEREITTVFDRLDAVGVGGSTYSRALDFGCGAGRLTQALAGRCGSVDGVDIAASMLNVAEGLKPQANVRLHHNTASDLARFDDGTFDFIYSSIVLQHMHPSLALGYLIEFIRVLAAGGVLVFQIPDRHVAGTPSPRKRLQTLRCSLALGTRFRARTFTVDRVAPAWQMEMHAVPESEVRAAFGPLPCRTVDIVYTNSAADDFNGRLEYRDLPPTSGWVSRQWTIVKDDGQL